MIAASSAPVRGLVIFVFLSLIYYLQPFAGGGGGGGSLRASDDGSTNIPTSSSSSSSSSTAATRPWVAPWHGWRGNSGERGGVSSSSQAQSETKDAFKATEGGPRIRQATMIYSTDKFNAVYERTLDTHIKHGKMWDIPTHVLRHDIVDAGFFNKPAYLLGLVIEEMAKPYGQRAGWIVWFDADTVILNPAVPWALFLPPAEFEDIHFVVTQDHNGFNAGMMFIRVHEWSVKMLAEVVALRQLRPELKYEFEDQGATRWVIERSGYEEHAIYQPHDWWNEFGRQGEPVSTDKFMLHFAGVEFSDEPEKKTTIVGRWLDILENRPETYAMPLANTSYPSKVAHYWKTLKAARVIMEKAEAWKKEKDSTPEDLKKAQEELREVIVRQADDVAKTAEKTNKVAEVLDQHKEKKSGD